jgi:hypothetical protein
VTAIGLSDTKQKSAQQATQANQYGYQTPPDTPDIAKLRTDKFEVDPGLHAEYGNLRNQVDKSAHDPMGASYNPQVVEQQRKAAMERLGTQEAQAYRSGQYDVNKLNYGRDVTVAGLTAPQLTQTGSSSTGSGTVTQSESPFKTVAGVAGAAAPLSL